MDTWKTRIGTLWHILASGIAAAGHFTLHVQESSECYRPKVRKVTPGSHALHHLVNHTFQHTFTHILGPLARFCGIPVLRRSPPPPPRNRRSVGPGGLPPKLEFEYLYIVQRFSFYLLIVFHTFLWIQGYLICKFWTYRSPDTILEIRGIFCPKWRKFRNLENLYHHIGNLIANSTFEESSKTELQISSYEFLKLKINFELALIDRSKDNLYVVS